MNKLREGYVKWKKKSLKKFSKYLWKWKVYILWWSRQFTKIKFRLDCIGKWSMAAAENFKNLVIYYCICFHCQSFVTFFLVAKAWVTEEKNFFVWLFFRCCVQLAAAAFWFWKTNHVYKGPILKIYPPLSIHYTTNHHADFYFCECLGKERASLRSCMNYKLMPSLFVALNYWCSKKRRNSYTLNFYVTITSFFDKIIKGHNFGNGSCCTIVIARSAVIA